MVTFSLLNFCGNRPEQIDKSVKNVKVEGIFLVNQGDSESNHMKGAVKCRVRDVSVTVKRIGFSKPHPFTCSQYLLFFPTNITHFLFLLLTVPDSSYHFIICLFYHLIYKTLFISNTIHNPFQEKVYSSVLYYLHKILIH